MTSAAMCCGNRGDRGVLGRSHSHLVRAGASSQRSNDDPVGARGDQRRRAAEQAAASRDRRPREFRRAGVPFLGVGPRRRPARQAGSHGRRGRQRLPDRARYCGRRRPPDCVPADRAVDPNPNYHAEVGPGVQWALRHLPFYGRWYRFLLFWPGCDKGLEAARVDAEYPDKQTAVSEINEITRIMFTELDQQPDRRRCGTAGQGGARLPGDGQAHPAGQWQLVAHADPRQRRVGQDWHRPHRIKRGRHRRRHPLPG